MGSGEEVRPHVKNEQSDGTGSPGGAAGCRTGLEVVPAEPGQEGSLARAPTHKSSKDFSTSTGSVLHFVLPKLQPAHV